MELNGQLKAWLNKWGPWLGPSTILLLLALSSRWQGYTWTKEEHQAFAQANQLRIEALDKRVDLIVGWIDEHKQLVTARTAQLDALDRDEAVTREAISSMKQDLQEIKVDLRELRLQRGMNPHSSR